jgi:hypothetical protein
VLHALDDHLSIGSLRLTEYEVGEFIPPEGPRFRDMVGNDEQGCWHRVSFKRRKGGEKIVQVAVVEGDGNRVRWQLTLDELSDKAIHTHRPSVLL